MYHNPAIPIPNSRSFTCMFNQAQVSDKQKHELHDNNIH